MKDPLTTDPKLSPERRMMQRLKSIQIAVDTILAHPALQKEAEGDPINWADLHCVEVRHWVGMNDDSGFTAFVEEAAPNCSKLIGYVHTRLKELGYKNVEVVTEW